MSRTETDREDLLAEAVALVRRVELRVPGLPENLVAGFRSDGRLSVYFGGDPAYHFDAAGRLRRAFVDGELFRTQGTTLARLRRTRTPAVTELVRWDLPLGELKAFIERMRGQCELLLRATEPEASAPGAVLRRVPGDDHLLPELRRMLETILSTDEPLAPPIKGKR
ncbi:MAG: hypothetical protein KY476_20980 [Planctomycetes bacterium]|nr:hypothetical protein [Planctomycetota bacterium]